jgi:hypothetical protein
MEGGIKESRSISKQVMVVTIAILVLASWVLGLDHIPGFQSAHRSAAAPGNWLSFRAVMASSHQTPAAGLSHCRLLISEWLLSLRSNRQLRNRKSAIAWPLAPFRARLLESALVFDGNCGDLRSPLYL